MGMARRRATIHKEREHASKDPDLYARYLEALDGLEQINIDFDKRAIEFWETHCAGVGYQEASELMFRALADAFAGLAAIPNRADGDKKKGRLTLNGSRQSPRQHTCHPV